MKASSAVFNENYGKKPNKVILPLVPDKVEEIPSGQMITHTLRSNPTDEDSPKYKIAVRILQGDESCREILNWRKDVEKILAGLNVTTHTPAIPIIETLMGDTPRALFNSGVLAAKRKNFEDRVMAEADEDDANAIHAQGMDHADNLTFDQITEGLKNVVRLLLPRRVLAKAKRHLRRECRKPSSMLVGTYYQHLTRMNGKELPRLPPFGANQSFSDEEILDIILFGTPKSWQREMEKQGFDPMDQPVTDVVDFMERLETTEDFDADKDTKSVAKKGNGKSGKKSANSKGKQNLYCMFHGENNSHKTEDCYQLQKEAKRLKKENNGNDKSYGKSKNKTWSRKAEEAKSASKNDLAVFIRKEVKKGVKKDLKAMSKKRKSEDSDSDGEIHMFDLKDFNYEDMENLKIDDDEEVSDEIST